MMGAITALHALATSHDELCHWAKQVPGLTDGIGPLPVERAYTLLRERLGLTPPMGSDLLADSAAEMVAAIKLRLGG